MKEVRFKTFISFFGRMWYRFNRMRTEWRERGTGEVGGVKGVKYLVTEEDLTLGGEHNAIYT